MDDVQQALSKLQSYTSSCPLRKGVEKVEEVREHPILQKKRQSLEFEIEEWYRGETRGISAFDIASFLKEFPGVSDITTEERWYNVQEYWNVVSNFEKIRTQENILFGINYISTFVGFSTGITGVAMYFFAESKDVKNVGSALAIGGIIFGIMRVREFIRTVNNESRMYLEHQKHPIIVAREYILRGARMVDTYIETYNFLKSLGAVLLEKKKSEKKDIDDTAIEDLGLGTIRMEDGEDSE